MLKSVIEQLAAGLLMHNHEQNHFKYYATNYFILILSVNFEVAITFLAICLVGAARFSGDSHSDSHWLLSDYNHFFSKSAPCCIAIMNEDIIHL